MNAYGGAWRPQDTISRAEFMSLIIDNGFDGAYFWDISQVVESGTEWEIIRQFGHREILDQILCRNMPEIRYHKTRKIYDLLLIDITRGMPIDL